MEKFLNFLEKVLEPIAVRIAGNKYMLALRDGFVYTLPFTLTGSIFLLLAFFPVPAVAEFMESTGLQSYLLLVSGVTFDLMAVLAVLGISYHLAKSNEDDAFVVAVLSLIIFFLLQAPEHMMEDGTLVSGVISKQYLGAQGVFTAIVIGMLVPYIFNKIIKRNLTIKLPDQVPPAVAQSFAAIFPVAIIIMTFWLFQVFTLALTDFTSLSQIIYFVIQTPLQRVGNSFFGVLLTITLPQLFWFFGLHGSTIVMGIMSPIYQANSLENLALYQEGMLSLENGAHLVTQNLFDSFMNIGGSGMTLGITVLLLNRKLFKSKQNNELGKLAIGPGIFTINEPVIFGTPIVFNPLLFVPFVLTPIVVSFITLSSIQLGIVPPFNGLILPWTTPPIISGFLICGWKGSVLQIFNIIVSALIYYPFYKVLDRQYVKRENKIEE